MVFTIMTKNHYFFIEHCLLIYTILIFLSRINNYFYFIYVTKNLKDFSIRTIVG